MHRFHQISTIPEQRNIYLQRGLREPLLCDDCEQKLSVYENYTSKILNGGVEVDVSEDKNVLYLRNIDYKKLKLFQLSILWRAGMSTLRAFSQVVLGQHAERLRQMIYAEDPGPTEAYGCIMFMIMNEREVMQDIIVQPTWSRLDKHKAYRFIFGGLAFIYVVSKHALSKLIIEQFLQDTGSAIVQLKQFKEIGYINNMMSKMHRLGKFSK